MLITPEYLEEQKRLHQDPEYGTIGNKWAYLVAGIATIERFDVVLDYGCGKGTLKFEVKKNNPPTTFYIFEYDPAVPGKDKLDPIQFDLVVCTDVMEHIEPSCLSDVIKHLSSITKKLLFVVISTKFDKHRWLTDGRNSHQIVEEGNWWADKFSPYFMVERTWNTGVKEWVALLRKK